MIWVVCANKNDEMEMPSALPTLRMTKQGRAIAAQVAKATTWSGIKHESQTNALREGGEGQRPGIDIRRPAKRRPHRGTNHKNAGRHEKAWIDAAGETTGQHHR
jgi:hypothetical protein